MADPIGVMLVEDHPIVSEGVERLLNRDGRFATRALPDGPAALEAYKADRADVVIVDLSLGRSMSGIELIAELRALDPEVKAVVFTSFTDPVNVTAALDAGAVGYLSKSTSPSDLPALLLDAYRGLPVYDAQTQQTVVALLRNRNRPAAPQLLTGREFEVLTTLCYDGGTNAEIAERLFLSESTVSTHMKKVLSKLGVSTRTKAITVAFQTGLVEPVQTLRR